MLNSRCKSTEHWVSNENKKSFVDATPNIRLGRFRGIRA